MFDVRPKRREHFQNLDTEPLIKYTLLQDDEK